MSRTSRIGLLGFVILLVVWSLYFFRHVIEAKMWHWRHGNFVTTGMYSIPVPPDWDVIETNNSVIMVDTFKRGTIAISGVPPLFELQRWKEHEEERLKKEGVNPQTRSFQISDTVGLCIAGKSVSDLLGTKSEQRNGNLMQIQCIIPHLLSIQFAGQNSDISPFYGVVDGIKTRR